MTTLQCQCQARVNPPVINWMKLLEDPRRRPRPVPTQEPIVVVDGVVSEPSPVPIVPPPVLDAPPAG